MRILFTFFFFLCSYIILLYISLVTIFLMTYIVFIFIFIYVDVCCFSPISPFVVSFLSLYICFFMYVMLYFCFTLRCLDEFCLKCFRKTGCENLLCHELSSYKVFQEFVLGYILLYWTSGYKFSDLGHFSHNSFVCCGFVMDFWRGRLLGHMWNMLRTYVI